MTFSKLRKTPCFKMIRIALHRKTMQIISVWTLNVVEICWILARRQYTARNKFDPLYLTNIVGGCLNGKGYLAYIDIFGSLIEDNWVCAGFASYCCKPLITRLWSEKLDEKTAIELVKECFTILFYRHARATDKYLI